MEKGIWSSSKLLSISPCFSSGPFSTELCTGSAVSGTFWTPLPLRLFFRSQMQSVIPSSKLKAVVGWISCLFISVAAAVEMCCFSTEIPRARFWLFVVEKSTDKSRETTVKATIKCDSVSITSHVALCQWLYYYLHCYTPALPAFRRRAGGIHINIYSPLAPVGGLSF